MLARQRFAMVGTVVGAAALLGVVAGSAGCASMPPSGKEKAETRASSATAPAARSLYERLGGEPALRAVVDDFVARGAANPKVNFTRAGKPNEWEATPQNVQTLKQRLVEFIGSATGGPQVYHGKDMVTVHTGMQITDAEFDALAADLKASLDKFDVPPGEQQELLTIVEGTRSAIVGK